MSARLLTRRFSRPTGVRLPCVERLLTKTQEEETIIINRPDRSTYPEEKSVLRSGATRLVGNAFGGNNIRTFAARYPAEVAGLVLVEADVVSSPEELRGHAKLVTSMRECRDAIAAGKPLPQLPTPPGGPARSCAQKFFFRGLPEAMWSPELNAKLLELAQTKVAMYDSYISEMEQVPADETYLEQHSRSLGSRPIRVLTTGNHGVHSLDPSRAPNPEHQKYEEEVAREQAKWLELSSNARQLFTDKSSEYIPFDQPSFVVDAVREVYSQSK